MEKAENTLDFETREQDFTPELVHASGGTRFANAFIDQLILLALTYGTAFILGMGASFRYYDFNQWISILLSYLIYFLYYSIFETATGKTPAKWITKTRVVNQFGKQPTIGQVLGRTLIRNVPFDAFSFFNEYSRGWHDKWSGTWVVDEQKMGISK